MIDQLVHERLLESQLVLPIGEPTSPHENEECDTLWNRVLRICDKYNLNVQDRPA